MNFTNLPTEVGILIYNYLDTKSKINVYNTCSDLREFFAPCHLKKILLSRNTIAIPIILDHELFVDWGIFVQELCLNSMPDLTSEILRPHMCKFPNLTILDIAYTDIYLSDFIEISPDKLRELSINFFKCPRRSMKENIWKDCQKVFKIREFVKVHFVVFELTDSDTPVMFLEGIPLVEDFKVTIADNYKDFWNNETETTDNALLDSDIFKINFSKLFYVLRDCRVTHKTSNCLRGIVNLDFKQIEYIFVMYLERIVVYVSPMLRSLFLGNCKGVRVKVCSQLPLDFVLDGNIIFKAWNKNMIFDEKFMKELLLDMKNYFPLYFCMDNIILMKIIDTENDWYCLDTCRRFKETPVIFPKYPLPKKLTLSSFCRKNGVISICNCSINLFDSGILRNVSFLRLSNVYNIDFDVLFSTCSVLETLDIYVEKTEDLYRGFTLPQSITLVKKLRNFKLTAEDIEYDFLFDILSQCSMLENIHICEYGRSFEENDIDINKIQFMMEKCVNLYSLFIETEMSVECLTMVMGLIKDIAQILGRNHLYINLCECYSGWNPFGDDFNPSPLHILD